MRAVFFRGSRLNLFGPLRRLHARSEPVAADPLGPEMLRSRLTPHPGSALIGAIRKVSAIREKLERRPSALPQRLPKN